MDYFIEKTEGLVRATPAQIVCYDDSDGDWTIDAEDVGGMCLRDSRGNYPASVWIDEENGGSPMTERQAIAAARVLRRQMGLPSLPILVWRDGASTPVAENVTN